jgi:tetratricopeptide (TPR) repeat protein
LSVEPDNPRALEMMASANEANARTQAQQHIRRGRYAKNEGRLEEAIWYFEQALSLEKNNLDARHLLAELLVDSRTDLTRAMALMKEVVVLGGQRARYYVTLGDIFLLAKDVERAQDAFQKALRMEPENREIKRRLKLCKK